MRQDDPDDDQVAEHGRREHGAVRSRPQRDAPGRLHKLVARGPAGVGSIGSRRHFCAHPVEYPLSGLSLAATILTSIAPHRTSAAQQSRKSHVTSECSCLFAGYTPHFYISVLMCQERDVNPCFCVFYTVTREECGVTQAVLKTSWFCSSVWSKFM